MLSQVIGIIWFSDGFGQVFKGSLLDYDRTRGRFWAMASRDCPVSVDVVVILKNGEVFPSGEAEWCGKTTVVDKEKLPDTPEGGFKICLQPVSA